MKKTLVCNWKMHGNTEYCEKITQLFSINYNTIKFNTIICPPYTLLHKFSKQNFHLGSQDCSAETQNFYTGEISLNMLKEFGVSHVIIGHSERRKYFSETTEKILCKLSLILEGNLNPIICVKKFVEDERYIKDVYNSFTTFMMNNSNANPTLYIAYEPEASIGSGISDNTYSIEENYLKIRNAFKNHNNVNVLYGGSVNHKNIEEILNICDGVLLGKASINFDEFQKILAVGEN
jgi:triosephosphate isomerase